MNLMKAIVFSPGELFKTSKEKKRDIILLFVFSFFIVFLKSFFKERHWINFYANQPLNELFSFFAIPQISVIATYFSFFIFVFVLFCFAKLFSKEGSFKQLLFALMSISGIGILSHLIVTPLNILSKSLALPICFIFYMWVVILTILAIKNTQSVAFVKAIPIFLLGALPFILFGWILVVSPYLGCLVI